MISYNLSTQKWIYSIMKNGELKYLSLEEVLVQADSIREIFYSSPIEEIALYRFLQVFFIIFTKASDSQENWDKAKSINKFDKVKVLHYFAEHHSKFDLFDSERPFYQHTDTLRMAKSPMMLLFQDISTNNNACLFDHSCNTENKWMPLSELAIGIISHQAFAFGGGISKPTNFRASTMPGASIFWIKGETLYESLLLNTPYLRDKEEPLRFGLPAWEKELPKSIQRMVTDYCDYLTFQSRRLKIELPDIVNDSNYNHHTQEIYCSLDNKGFSISRCQGDYLGETNTEPLIAQKYREDKKEFIAYKLSKNRNIWQDSILLYTAFYSDDKNNVKKSYAPKNITKLSYLKRNLKIENQFYNINVYTVNNESGQPKIIKWRRSIMPFYPVIMKADGETNEKFDAMIKLLAKAENISKLLYVAVLNYTKILKKPKVYIKSANTIDKDIQFGSDGLKLIKAMAEKLNPQNDYWKALEPIFYNSLGSIAKKNDNENYDDIYKDFKSKSFNTALNAFDAALYNAGSAKAYSIARNTFFNYKDQGDE